jgi:uncharacterized membrane protein YbaN (DUF454 family)
MSRPVALLALSIALTLISVSLPALPAAAFALAAIAAAALAYRSRHEWPPQAPRAAAAGYRDEAAPPEPRRPIRWRLRVDIDIRLN